VPDALSFAVIGHPINHSRSPEIHRAFARQFGIRLDYRRIDAEPGQFQEEVARFFSEGGTGLNVTLPHKLAAAQLSADLSERARRAGAVNTLSVIGSALTGDNTDGIGLFRDLLRITREVGVDSLKASILVIGAGGAAQGALSGLLDAGCTRLVVAARDHSKAKTLCERLSHADRIEALEWTSQASPGSNFDIVINATAANHHGETLDVQESWLSGTTLAYDLGYSARGESERPFLQYARSRGVAHVADGFGMLVEQAAESFFVWHGVKPTLAPVLAEMKEEGT
jgi:shikimate dehydrogenase